MKVTLKEAKKYLNKNGIGNGTNTTKGLLEQIMVEFAQEQVNKLTIPDVSNSVCKHEGCTKSSTCGDYCGTHCNCRKSKAN